MNRIEFGDCRDTMRRWASEGVKAQTCVTSPPYFGLRDYGHEGQIGLEQTPEEYIAAMVEVFRCVRDLLADDGTLWLNIGDSYGNGKQLLGLPWRVALALQLGGWVLRQDIIWHKPNPMPESVRDRCTKAHEYIFLLSKSDRYFYDAEASREPAVQAGRVRNDKIGGNKGDDVHHSPGGQFTGSETRNRRSVWTVATRPYKGAHFATFPPALIEPCILSGSRPNDIVLDPFMGSGTTAAVALQHGRQYLGCELNEDYNQLQQERINKQSAADYQPQMSLID
jgi:DNA modification methylase